MFDKRFRISWLFVSCLLLCFGSALIADYELGIREYEVPLIEGQVHSRMIIQTLLEAGGSDVILPDDFPNQKIELKGLTARVTLATWNIMLKDFGVDLQLTDEKLMLEVDLKTLEATLDEFEEKFLSFFKVERKAEMMHISDAGSTGPVVVLLHGLDSSRRLFYGVCTYLVDAGYDLYFFEYPNDDRVERNADRLAKALQDVPSDREHGISLVTVSMGGVIGQLVLESPEYAETGVTRFIACVPPFQGSEMAGLRGVIEIGDHAMSVIFDPKKALDFWGDGMGRAGIDLQPRSLLMEKMDLLERNPEVSYSILAGSKGMFDPTLLGKAREELAEEQTENALTETARRLTIDRIDLFLKFQAPNGDGVVTLESAKLEGVDDRVVLPYSHLDFLTGFSANEDIVGLKELLERLPPVEEE